MSSQRDLQVRTRQLSAQTGLASLANGDTGLHRHACEQGRTMPLGRSAVLLAATVAILALQPSGRAAAAPASAAAPRIAETHHVGRFGGEKVAYTATVAETLLKDAKGAPSASVITIAYTRDDVKDQRRRPVMFLFNGGPGASSSPLHGALGPMRRASAGGLSGQTASTWVANPLSPLDAFDLVFIDPAGTGFSRVLPGADPKRFYAVKGDALEVAEVIKTWLAAHHREASPRYLTGESYGTVRAAAIAREAPDLKFDGVLLVAVAAPPPGREMPYVTRLPTMAVGAWYHHKIDRAGRSPHNVYWQAVEFARTDYVSALIKGSSLEPAERRRVAERMSALIGLPADFIEAKDLRISANDYMFTLLKDRGLRTGMLDVRVTAPLEPGQLGDIDDPALGVVPPRGAGKAPADPPSPASVGPVQSPAMASYLRDELKFPVDEPYYAINFTANSEWDLKDDDAGFGSIAEAMKANPDMRLFWAAGYFDLATPAYAGRYAFDQDGIPADRLTTAYFEGPHAVYDGDQNLRAFTAAVRAFVEAGGRARRR
jgi:carboxypeptidase C (cathepsin A)